VHYTPGTGRRVFIKVRANVFDIDSFPTTKLLMPLMHVLVNRLPVAGEVGRWKNDLCCPRQSSQPASPDSVITDQKSTHSFSQFHF